jgi:hypothetical protein
MTEPWGLALRIIRLRDYVSARRYIDQTELKDLRMSKMVQTVLETQAKIQLG